MRANTSTVQIIIALLCLSQGVLAQGNYASFELRRAENWDPIVLEDMNGDGRKDIISSHYEPELGRELHIYHQRADSRFEAEPQRIEIKTEIIAVGFADIRPDPGKELVLFANNGVFSLASGIEGYAGNLKLLAQWPLIASIPDLERVRFTNIPADINQDGEIDLLLAGDDRYGLFLGNGAEEFELVFELRTLNLDITPLERSRNEVDLDANLSINPEQGVVVELNVEAPSPFQGFIEQWQLEELATNALLGTDTWMPTAVLAMMNNDSLPDLVYLNAGKDGLGRINIHFQSPDTLFNPEPDWVGDIDSRGKLELLDFNGDKVLDVLHLSGDGSDWTARFFSNNNGEFELNEPQQIMRFSGYDMALNVLQMPDGNMILNASYYTIPVVDAIRNASISRIQLIYGSDNKPAGQVFNRRLDSRLEESFSAQNVRGLSEQMSLQYDVDGDGRRDALYVTENGTLAAKRIGADLQIAAEPFWEYISQRTVFEFEVLALNEDNKPDLILKHGTSTRFLVALP